MGPVFYHGRKREISWILASSWNYFKCVGVFLLQLRRMQEMIAQMQAQMRMKPGDD